MVSQDGLGDLIPHTHDGIESRHRLLKNHREIRATQLAHGIVGKGAEIASALSISKKNFARDSRLRRQQSHDGQRSNRLAGTGFAD